MFWFIVCSVNFILFCNTHAHAHVLEEFSLFILCNRWRSLNWIVWRICANRRHRSCLFQSGICLSSECVWQIVVCGVRTLSGHGSEQCESRSEETKKNTHNGQINECKRNVFIFRVIWRLARYQPTQVHRTHRDTETRIHEADAFDVSSNCETVLRAVFNVHSCVYECVNSENCGLRENILKQIKPKKKKKHMRQPTAQMLQMPFSNFFLSHLRR